MAKDPTATRLYKKALANQLAIAVGSSMANERYSLPTLAGEIKKEFAIDFTVDEPVDWFIKWNEFLEVVDNSIPPNRDEARLRLGSFVAERLRGAEPTPLQRAIAHIPISNFIDATFDRSFQQALLAAKRTPIVHDWDRQAMGDWKQPNVTTPNLFFMMPNPAAHSPLLGLFEQVRKNNMHIQTSNVAHMLRDKDLLLLDFSPEEAEWILSLYEFSLSGAKIFNYTEEEDRDSPYWCHRGVMTVNQSPEMIVRELLPSRPGTYGMFDILIPRRLLSDMMRDKEYACFISYFHGDKDFVRTLEGDLDRRGLYIWRDEHEIEIGDSLSDKIQEGLKKSYSAIVVLSPEALERPFFKQELNTAFALRLEGKFKIFPVLLRHCELPLFLRDTLYADFSAPDFYELRLADLERAIKNAVARAQDKL